MVYRPHDDVELYDMGHSAGYEDASQDIDDWREAFSDYGLGSDDEGYHEFCRDEFKAGYEAGQRAWQERPDPVDDVIESEA